MSTSLLYHAYGVRGVQYKSTKYEEGSTTFHAEMNKTMKCKCGCKKTIFKGNKTRKFKMVPFGSKPCFLSVLIHRLECTKCGNVWWPQLPFMKGKFRMTRGLITHINDLLNFCTIIDISRLLNVSWNVIKRIHKSVLQIKYKKINLKDLEYITVDEFSIRKNHEYMTIFTDLRTGRIIHAVEGRTIEDVAPFLKKLKKEAPNLKGIAMDMSQSYFPAVQEFLPNVDVIFDHFHVTALMNKAIDNVRREQMNRLDESNYQVFKGNRFLFLHNYENLDTEKQSRLETLLAVNEPLCIAYTMKEQFRLFWRQKNEEDARLFLLTWAADALTTGVKQLQKLAKTLLKYCTGLFNYFKHRITNASAEGLNNKIKTLKRQAYGFRDIEYFKLRLYNLHESKYTFVG